MLRFHPELAPVKIAVLPLLKKRPEIVATCHDLRTRLARRWITLYDDTAAIGRLYRRQDEVGTPYCVTVDVKTVGDAEKGETGDQRVTIRERDSMEQIRVPIAELEGVFAKLLDEYGLAGRRGGVSARGGLIPHGPCCRGGTGAGRSEGDRRRDARNLERVLRQRGGGRRRDRGGRRR